MRAVWLTLCLVGVGMPLAFAQDRKFPYEALVDVDEEFVRSGNGTKFYPTGKLSRGATVTVHHHDPGGWAAIMPPPGSFSWVRADYVQRLDKSRGTLTSNNVIVHIGSTLGDDRNVYFRTLSKGDVVEVLGEKEMLSESGPVVMYKIKPPPREYRWIAIKALVPSASLKAGPGSKPLRQPAAPQPNITGPIAQNEQPLPTIDGDPFAPIELQPPVTNTSTSSGLTRATTSELTKSVAEVVDPLRQRFDELDQKLREMVAEEPQSWNLTPIEQGLLQLDKQVTNPGLHGQIAFRLRQIKKYQKIQQDFANFYKLTSETKQRDAQLLTLQQKTEEQLRQLEAGSPTSPSPSSPSNAPLPTPTQPAKPPTGVPSTSPTGMTAPVPPPSSPGPKPVAAGAPKFDGAGIVQRSKAPGKPAYCIVAPDGKLLAYLQPPEGLDLAPFVDFAMGIIGARAFDAGLQADVIQVREMQPVQLRAK